MASAISRHLTAAATLGRRTVRLLDPCAGTGDAVATIAASIGAQTFGIELNSERAAAARQRLDHALAASAFSVRIANGAFSCLFLNPPYSHDEEKRRLEHAFLTSLTRALAPGGVLVFVIPQRRLEVSARYLANHYRSFAAWRFPDPEYERFQQIVLFATRKSSPSPNAEVQARLELWATVALDPLPAEPSDPRYELPVLTAGEVLFAPLFFDPTLAAVEARRKGVWAQSQLADQLWPPDDVTARPLMPLRRGHLALLIAAGMLNNLVLGNGSERVLVKGRTSKEFVPVETTDENSTAEREVLRTSVVLLDVTTGRIETVGQEQAGRKNED